MSITVGKVGIADASFGTLPLSQISVGPVIVWERNKPNGSMVLAFDETATDIELPLEQYLTKKWDVDWGDGTKVKMGKAHSYTDGRKHRVTITGSAMWGVLAGTVDTKGWKEGLVSVETVGTCPIRAWCCHELAGGTFQGCKKLESVDDGLFNGVVRYDEGRAMHNSTKWNFYNLFLDCEKLAFIPEKLFSNTAKTAWPDTSTKHNFNINFSYVLAETPIHTIPEKLFSGFPELMYADSNGGFMDFYYAFQHCKNLDPLPNIFNHLPSSAQSMDWRGAFSGCTSLGKGGFSESSGIKSGLFKNLPNIVGNSSVQYSLRFNACFGYCTALQGIPSDILEGVPNSGRTMISFMFSGCTGLKYDVPAVWETHKSTSHMGFYLDCTNASNYQQIPSGWK